MRRPGAAAVLGVFLAAALLLLGARTAGAETIGSIKNASGGVFVLRDTQTIPAAPGFRLQAGDILETQAGASVGVILRDDSLVSLGPSSRIALERFAFVPAEGKLGFTARLVRGTMAYLSGLIARLAPGSTTFVTPVATIGVRGTRLAVRVAD